MRNQPGRPPGPMDGRGQEPWDPVLLTDTHKQRLDFLARHLHWRRADVAAELGVSMSHLSILANSPAGRAFLATLGVSPDMTATPADLQPVVVNLDEFL
jgi:hypothetical protein